MPADAPGMYGWLLRKDARETIAHLQDEVRRLSATSAPMPTLHQRLKYALAWANCHHPADRKAWDKGRAGLAMLVRMTAPEEERGFEVER